MHTKIVLGPQTYTVPVELEAEVRRLLWAQLRPEEELWALAERVRRGGGYLRLVGAPAEAAPEARPGGSTPPPRAA